MESEYSDGLENACSTPFLGTWENLYAMTASLCHGLFIPRQLQDLSYPSTGLPMLPEPWGMSRHGPCSLGVPDTIVHT